MTDAAAGSSALAGLERRLGFVEGDGVIEDPIPCAGDAGHEGGGHFAVFLTSEAGSPVSAPEEAVHTSGPLFPVDVDQGLESVQVMGVAGAVAHTLESEV